MATSANVSAGAAAGIGVGVALAIIALAAAALWGFLLRHRYQNITESIPLYRFPAALGHPDKGKKGPPNGPPPKPPVLSKRVSSSPLASFYLRGPADKDIMLELQAVGYLIRDHGEHFYYKGPLAKDSLPRIISSLSGFGLDTETQRKIANFALDKSTRDIAIRALLVHVIFSALDIRSGGSMSLLPPSVAAFIKEIPVDLTGKVKLALTDLAVLMTWRRSAAFLLNDLREGRYPLEPPTDMDAQIKGVTATVQEFLSILLPEDSEVRVKQSESLVRVIRASCKFGYLLFSSPCEWRLLLNTKPGSSGVVVVPGLERLSNYDDEMLDPGKVVVEPAVRDAHRDVELGY